jgi:hypothetical protein
VSVAWMVERHCLSIVNIPSQRPTPGCKSVSMVFAMSSWALGSHLEQGEERSSHGWCGIEKALAHDGRQYGGDQVVTVVNGWWRGATAMSEMSCRRRRRPRTGSCKRKRSALGAVQRVGIPVSFFAPSAPFTYDC